MLYLARYEVDLDNIETAMAKRLEWDNVAPDAMKIVCEMYYGRTVRLDIRPCSDVLAAMEMTRKSLAAAG